MKNICVVDFDRTLIDTNSINLIIKKLKTPTLFFWAFLRKLKIINKKKFAFHVTNYIDKYIDRKGIQMIENIIVKHINNVVLEHIKSNMLVDSEIIIISASPHKYISHIAKNYNFKGFGSYFNESGFNYLYGINKITFLKREYPMDKYYYYYAISDHYSDVKLLNLFERKFLVVDKYLINEISKESIN